jgi:hypothetical protein
VSANQDVHPIKPATWTAILTTAANKTSDVNLLSQVKFHMTIVALLPQTRIVQTIDHHLVIIVVNRPLPLQIIPLVVTITPIHKIIGGTNILANHLTLMLLPVVRLHQHIQGKIFEDHHLQGLLVIIEDPLELITDETSLLVLHLHKNTVETHHRLPNIVDLPDLYLHLLIILLGSRRLQVQNTEVVNPVKSEQFQIDGTILLVVNVTGNIRERAVIIRERLLETILLQDEEMKVESIWVVQHHNNLGPYLLVGLVYPGELLLRAQRCMLSSILQNEIGTASDGSGIKERRGRGRESVVIIRLINHHHLVVVLPRHRHLEEMHQLIIHTSILSNIHIIILTTIMLYILILMVVCTKVLPLQVVGLRVDLLAVVIQEIKDRLLVVVVLHPHNDSYRVNSLPASFPSIRILVREWGHRSLVGLLAALV